MSNVWIKQAKSIHKESIKNKESYEKGRDEMISSILKSNTPNWGGISLKVVNW